MKRILAILLQLLCAAVAFAVLPTPVTLTVSVNTNGVVVGPTNFWAANSNAIAAVAGGGGGTDPTKLPITGGTIEGSLFVTNATYAKFKATNFWVEARTSLKLYSPAVWNGTATAGQYLRLTDDADGSVEFGALEDTVLAAGSSLQNALLLGWAAASAFTFTSAPRDADGLPTVATVRWPDGSSGTYTVTVKNSTFLTIDAYTVTHTATGKTVSQPTMTRDASGNVIAQPALTITQ